MQSVYRDIKADKVIVYPLGDIHIGDKSCDMERFNKYMEHAMQDDEIPRLVIGMGDIMNVATRKSASSPHEQNLTLDDQLDLAYEKFSPLGDRLLGIVIGNHEDRLIDEAGFSPTRHLCNRLNVPYLGYSAVVAIRVNAPGRAKGGKSYTKIPQYVFYVHHCSGGGDTPGGKMNRVVKLAQVFPDADIYCGGHTHGEGTYKQSIYRWDEHSRTIVERDRIFLNTGAFLKYDGSYAEAKQMVPTSRGAPSVTLSGKKKMVTVNQFVVEE
jgi:predicted phosphodiesterase